MPISITVLCNKIYFYECLYLIVVLAITLVLKKKTIKYYNLNLILFIYFFYFGISRKRINKDGKQCINPSKNTPYTST